MSSSLRLSPSRIILERLHAPCAIGLSGCRIRVSAKRPDRHGAGASGDGIWDVDRALKFKFHLSDYPEFHAEHVL